MRSLESFLSEVPFSPIDAISVTTPTSGQNKIYEIWTLAVRLKRSASGFSLSRPTLRES